MTDTRPLGGDSNKFYGEYIGVVENDKDPEKLLRAQVRVFSIFTDEVPKKDLPWAEYRLPVGCRVNDGFFTPADVGDFVWVKFPYDGDTRRPVIIGSANYAPKGKPYAPHEAWEGEDMHVHKRTGDEEMPEPHKYHEDAIYTQHGITIERNKDTSFSIYQRATGTEICIDKKGNIVIHSENNLWGSAAKNLKIIVGKDTNIETVGHTLIKSDNKIDLNGGGPVKGVVQGDCNCMVTGKPHPHISATVKASP